MNIRLELLGFLTLIDGKSVFEIQSNLERKLPLRIVR